jgi:23S rRNA (uridine2552-2'-O)-methyltransferase
MGSKPYDPRDAFYRKAKAAGLRARSAYKLEEIARRFHLYRPGMAVLDLGAAPGGWLQILSKLVGPKGLVVGVDLQPIEPVAPNVRTLVGDITAESTIEKLRSIRQGKYDALTSDMAPKTTGIKDVDESRSVELVRVALGLCDELLEPEGSFVAKVFEGSEFPALLADFKKRFSHAKLVRPEATRGRSFEIYVVATGFRGPPEGV